MNTQTTDYIIAAIRQRATTEAELLRYGGQWITLCERLGLPLDTPAQELAALVDMTETPAYRQRAARQ